MHLYIPFTHYKGCLKTLEAPDGTEQFGVTLYFAYNLAQMPTASLINPDHQPRKVLNLRNSLVGTQPPD
jgi:hypothetical protein